MGSGFAIFPFESIKKNQMLPSSAIRVFPALLIFDSSCWFFSGCKKAYLSRSEPVRSYIQFIEDRRSGLLNSFGAGECRILYDQPSAHYQRIERIVFDSNGFFLGMSQPLNVLVDVSSQETLKDLDFDENRMISIWARNPRYEFMITGKNEKWTTESVVAGSSPGEIDFQYAKAAGIAHSAIAVAYHNVFLWDLPNDERFRITGFSETTLEGMPVVKVDLECLVDSRQGMKGTVQELYLDYSTGQVKLLRTESAGYDYVSELRVVSRFDRGKQQIIEVTNSIANGSLGSFRREDLNLILSYKILNVADVPIDQDNCYLSHYGLPEPKINHSFGLRSSIIGIVISIFVAGLLILVFIRRGR